MFYTNWEFCEKALEECQVQSIVHWDYIIYYENFICIFSLGLLMTRPYYSLFIVYLYLAKQVREDKKEKYQSWKY